MSELREAAQRALSELRVHTPAAAHVARVTLDVVAEGRSELVTVSLTDGRLLCMSSDGKTDGPHALAALRLLSGLDVDTRPSHSLAPPAADVRVEESAIPASSVADHLVDLITAVARTGVIGAAEAPSVTEALDRLRAAMPNPPPVGFSRWAGRLKEALARRDPDLAARLLDGGARMATDLRSRSTSKDASTRRFAWWGEANATAGLGASLVERHLVEVGREWLAGLGRAELQRRYLVDVDTGTIYREERRRDHAASVGPCPRKLTVGLGHALPGAPPEPLRLLQYAVAPTIDGESWLALEGHADRDYATLAERYRGTQRAFPGQAEPFAIVSPERLGEGHEKTLVDSRGYVLPLARSDDPAAAERFDALAAGEAPTWVAGRLLDEGGRLMLAPVAAAWGSGHATKHVRLR